MPDETKPNKMVSHAPVRDVNDSIRACRDTIQAIDSEIRTLNHQREYEENGVTHKEDSNA